MRSRGSLMLFSILALTQLPTCASTCNRPTCSLDNLSHQLASIQSSLSHNATLLSVTHVPLNGSYGDNTTIPGLPPMFSTGLPELCAVEVNVTSSESSSYRFSLLLPSKWNSRFLAVGGAGLAGYINYQDMGAHSHYGFATMSTDNGHRSSPIDASWTYKAPEKQRDWGWRAMHGSVELSKQLIKRYYRQDIQYSYYSGCSIGGRQGLKEAQIDETSFDGMLIGAAAW